MEDRAGIRLTKRLLIGAPSTFLIAFIVEMVWEWHTRPFWSNVVSSTFSAIGFAVLYTILERLLPDPKP
jgi:hypothetical protein